MLTFMFNYRWDKRLLDVRALPTRRHDGVLFNEIILKHPKARQDPLYRAIHVWNKLPNVVRLIEHKALFKIKLIDTIPNAYKTFV